MHPAAVEQIEEILEEDGAETNPVLFANCREMAIEIWEMSALPYAPQVVAALRRCTDVGAARALLAEG